MPRDCTALARPMGTLRCTVLLWWQDPIHTTFQHDVPIHKLRLHVVLLL
uniref:p6 n=1 Tax=Insect-associated tombusvirus 1 TaxID=2692406 RepID=A0A6B9KU55_9TOMB|nr:p6 [Insect-associated tombusvirus 1]